MKSLAKGCSTEPGSPDYSAGPASCLTLLNAWSIALKPARTFSSPPCGSGSEAHKAAAAAGSTRHRERRTTGGHSKEVVIEIYDTDGDSEVTMSEFNAKRPEVLKATT